MLFRSLMLYRPNPDDDCLDQERNRILKIAKNKEYRRGKWPLYFDGSRQTFAVLMPDEAPASDSKKVLRDLVEAGKAARVKNRMEMKRAQVDGQQSLGFREVQDGPDNPFAQEVKH